MFLLVMQPNTIFFRHAEQLILVGPVVEGFVGGLSTFNGVFHAFVLTVPMRLLRSHPLHFSYVTDCTRPGSRLDTTFSVIFVLTLIRSQIFSTIQGIVFVGLSFGPWVILTMPLSGIQLIFSTVQRSLSP